MLSHDLGTFACVEDLWWRVAALSQREAEKAPYIDNVSVEDLAPSVVRYKAIKKNTKEYFEIIFAGRVIVRMGYWLGKR